MSVVYDIPRLQRDINACKTVVDNVSNTISFIRESLVKVNTNPYDLTDVIERDFYTLTVLNDFSRVAEAVEGFATAVIDKTGAKYLGSGLIKAPREQADIIEDIYKSDYNNIRHFSFMWLGDDRFVLIARMDNRNDFIKAAKAYSL